MQFRRIATPKQRYVDHRPSLYRAAVTNNRTEWDECQQRIEELTEKANQENKNG